MLQSWGSVSCCQPESSKPGASALGSAEVPYVPLGSVASAVLTSLNRQPPSKLSVRVPSLSTPRLGSPDPELQPTGPRSLGDVVAACAAAVESTANAPASTVAVTRAVSLKAISVSLSRSTLATGRIPLSAQLKPEIVSAHTPGSAN